jgi:hypothetical protein
MNASRQLSNGQCAHRWPGMGRCLELAVTTRPLQIKGLVIYDTPLCENHATFFDKERVSSCLTG